MSLRPRLTLIAAISEDGFISRGQGVPWNLPRDRRNFRSATAGKWLLIGRRTYQEMLGWFEDHTPLVLTQNRTFVPSVGKVVHSIHEALDLAAEARVPELFVCGGAGVYADSISIADRLLVTHVKNLLGDGVRFPAIESPPWHLISKIEHPADDENAFKISFATYERQKEKSAE
ncbi:MAG: dihydrofolate reductase [Prosthecobacter sp.]